MLKLANKRIKISFSDQYIKHLFINRVLGLESESQNGNQNDDSSVYLYFFQFNTMIRQKF